MLAVLKLCEADPGLLGQADAGGLLCLGEQTDQVYLWAAHLLYVRIIG